MTMQQILFNAANLFVLPFWILMIIFPNWQVTRRVMQSLLCFVPLGLLYLYFYVGVLSPEFFQSLLSPQLAYIASLCASQTVIGWVHFLAIDLFVGRWIYWKGQRTGIWTTHSLLFQFLAGPIGILSHIFTVWSAQKFFPHSEQVIESSN